VEYHHYTNLSDMSVEMLYCYDCGNEYGHVGTGPHPGRCPACDSVCVPPAGELTVVDRLSWQSANGLSKAWIHTVDDHDRPFTFEVAAKGSHGKLVAVHVDRRRIDPRVSEQFTAVPSGVEDAVAELGVSDVTTPRIGVPE